MIVAKELATPASEDPRISLKEALDNPEVRKMLLEAVQTEEAAPSGSTYRNYESELGNLGVTGGLEVAHPDNQVPLEPPSNVPRYVAENGQGTTDHIEPIYMTDAQGERQLMHQGAKRDANNEPVKTRAHLLWIDTKMNGGRLSSKVRSGIEVRGEYVPGGDGDQL